MTTVARDQDHHQRLEQIDAQAAQRWAAYGERLRDLNGVEYETEEAAAWDELQHALAPLHGERARLAAEAEDRSGR